MTYPKGALSCSMVITQSSSCHPFPGVVLLTHLTGILTPTSSAYPVTYLKHCKTSPLQYFIGALIALFYIVHQWLVFSLPEIMCWDLLFSLHTVPFPPC